MSATILPFRALRRSTVRHIETHLRRCPAQRPEIPGPLNAVTLLVSALCWCFVIASVWAISYLATFL